MKILMIISVISVLIDVALALGLEYNFDKPALYQIIEPLEHTECPTWDGRKNLLYFVDIHQGKIFSYNYTNRALHNITVYGDVAPVIPSAKDPNLLLVGVNRSIMAVEWDGKGKLEKKKILTTVADDRPTSRFNDGKADKEGRLWIGTMGYESKDGTLNPNEGALYKVDRQNINTPLPIINPVNISNGLAWNSANNKLYYIDTPTYKIMSYDYDNEKGEISNPEPVFDFKGKAIGGAPDGMTIDKDDNLWVALYGGGAVVQIDPREGKILQRIAIPAKHVTSVMFGGPKLDILFVTTSRYALNEAERLALPAAGSVFAITHTATSGVPVFNADIVEQI